jgi:dihydrofolate reductase
MPRVVYATASTLNGFLADDQDSLDWLFVVPGADEAEGELGPFIAACGAIVMGSTTYQWLLRHEQLLEHPHKWPYAQPAFVFSSRGQPAIPGADVRFVRGAVADAWPEISAAAGDIDVWLVGGGDLVGQFADAGLLDEIWVSVAPVTLVSGRPLLPRRLESDRLELVSATRSGQFAELRFAFRRG